MVAHAWNTGGLCRRLARAAERAPLQEEFPTMGRADGVPRKGSGAETHRDRRTGLAPAVLAGIREERCATGWHIRALLLRHLDRSGRWSSHLCGSEQPWRSDRGGRRRPTDRSWSSTRHRVWPGIGDVPRPAWMGRLAAVR